MARRYLHRALEEDDDAKVADLLGQSYYLEGELDEAEQCWRRPCNGTRIASARGGGSASSSSSGVVSRRRSSRSRAVTLEPRAVGPLYSLAHAYRRLGRREEADRLMEQHPAAAAPAAASHAAGRRAVRSLERKSMTH